MINQACERRTLPSFLSWLLLCSSLAACAPEEAPPFAPKDEDPRRDGGPDESDSGTSEGPPGLVGGFVLSDKVKEWGATSEDPIKICTGEAHTCAINPSGKVVCWGYTRRGAVAVPGELLSETAVMVACGGNHSCALTDGDDVYCWGSNSHGQIDVPAGSYKSVSAGAAHSCAIDEDDEVVCWGAGSEATTNILIDYGQARPPGGQFRGLSAGYLHTCAIEIRNNRARCWGQEGPRAETPSVELKSISGGWFHTCAIDMDDEVHCWGDGDDDNAPCDTLGGPRPDCGQGIPPDAKLAFIAAAASHSCGITPDLELSCWGDNTYKQLNVPKVELPGMGAFAAGYTQVAGSDNHTCGITAAGDVDCWGHSGNGKLRVPEEEFE